MGVVFEQNQEEGNKEGRFLLPRRREGKRKPMYRFYFGMIIAAQAARLSDISGGCTASQVRK